MRIKRLIFILPALLLIGCAEHKMHNLGPPVYTATNLDGTTGAIVGAVGVTNNDGLFGTANNLITVFTCSNRVTTETTTPYKKTYGASGSDKSGRHEEEVKVGLGHKVVTEESNCYPIASSQASNIRPGDALVGNVLPAAVISGGAVGAAAVLRPTRINQGNVGSNVQGGAGGTGTGYGGVAQANGGEGGKGGSASADAHTKTEVVIRPLPPMPACHGHHCD